jgi:thioredoxin-dependent peroxiredoxin
MEQGFANRHTFYIGKDGRILYVDREVKPQSAGEDVAKRLADLKIPQRAAK